jgi:UDP-N-acetylmuramoyl-tripeptide--D-alanyl-D-alanine ligase
MFKKIVVWKLKFFAKKILFKYKPKIIGITGSVGKTSAKDAALAVLESRFSARASIKNYNNEFGLPLSIIGCDSPGRNVLGWVAVFLKAARLAFFYDKFYPKVLVLEMGVDKVGDMDLLNSIVSCDVGLVTTIGASHLEQFGSVDKIQKEKVKMITNINKGGRAIFNYDDERTRSMSKSSKVKVMTYGFSEEADLQAGNIIFKFEEEGQMASLAGVSFKMSYNGSVVPVVLPNVIGTAAVYAALAAAAIGVAMEMNLVDIAATLAKFNSPKGRMKLLDGVKGTMIIDDTYNASPQSCLAAIEFVGRIKAEPGSEKVAVMGDMLELGSLSEESHRQVGQALVKAGFDLIITCGERSRDIGRGAVDAGAGADSVFHFATNVEAGKFAQERIKKGDLILVKGSQGARMEKVVKELMADPVRAKDFLVRQGADWEDK